MGQALNEYAVTFFTLLSEAYKQEIFDKRWQLLVSSYPQIEDEDERKGIADSLVLPDDVLSDILEGEPTEDDINKLKEALKNGN